MSDRGKGYSHYATKLFLTHHIDTKSNAPVNISDKMLRLLGNSKIRDLLRDMITNGTWGIEKNGGKNYNKLYQDDVIFVLSLS